MLALFMNGAYETRSRWVDKIAFFSLFIVVLLVAYFIVIQRFAIVLSEPVELDCAGLSVCIPVGTGWRSEKQWKYQQNAFSLDSFFAPGSVTTVVSCRYSLAAVKASANELFEEKVSTMGRSRIAETGRIEINGALNTDLPILNWAHMESLSGGRGETKTLLDMFFGVAQLPNNRRLEIEVYQAAGDTSMAEEVFRSVIKSLKLTDNHLLEVGGKIVTAIKDKGLDSFLASAGNEQGQDQESFFLVKDARENTIGFVTEVLGSRFAEGPQDDAAVKPAPEAQLDILAWNFYYIRGQYDREQLTFFKGKNDLSEFVWKSETSGPGDRSSVGTVLDKNGIMTVREFGPRARGRNYQISPAGIPDILGDCIFSQMLDSEQKEIFVDIIGADGRITPALVSRIDAHGSSASRGQSNETAGREEVGYIFKVELLDGRGFFEQVYLDDQRRVSGRMLQHGDTYTLERTVAENILREFPEHGGHILGGRDESPEQSQLQESGEQ